MHGQQEIRMIVRLMVTFALAGLGVPASAASPLFPFAHDERGMPVLEYYPATAAKFTSQGRDWVRLTVKETYARGPIDIPLVVDCQSQQMMAPQVQADPKGGGVLITQGLKPPPEGMYQRFVIALCDGELLGVRILPAKSAWVHFLEGRERALYFVRDSLRKVGKYRAASVRLYELGGAQLSDGRYFDARDAVWVVDCERKLGAVAYERAFARVGLKNQTVTSIGDERAFANPSIVAADKLTFGQAAAGSLQAKFTDMLCLTNSQ
jgi:hypothetical protein